MRVFLWRRLLQEVQVSSINWIFPLQSFGDVVSIEPNNPVHLSSTNPTMERTPVAVSITPQLGAPKIAIQPKSKVHPRNMKELGKKEIPFLPGDGPQRTPIKIKVRHC